MLLDESYLEESTAPVFDGNHPLPLNEAKQYMNVGFSDKDAEILRMVESVTLREQENLGIQIPTATYKIYFDGFCDRMAVARPPVTAISSVNYLDQDGAEQTVTSTIYRTVQLNQRRRPALVLLGDSQTWPTAQGVERDVWITFTCGYASGSVPADVRAFLSHGVDLEFTGRPEDSAMERLRGNLMWTSAI